MAGEVDRLLSSMRRVEKLEAQLENTDPHRQRWIRIALEPAREAANAAFEALRSAAMRGDPEAEVALDALAAQEG